MKMFKKSLVAASVAVAATAAYAGNITGGGDQLALEGTVAAGTVEIGGVGNLSAQLTSETQYIENDVLVFNIGGAAIDTENSDPQLTIGGMAAAGETAPNAIDMTENQIRFRIQTNGNTEGTTFTLSGVQLDTTGLVSGDDITVGANAISLNELIGVYDASDAEVIAEVRPQFGVATGSLAALDGTIDVEASRKLFDGATPNKDELSFTLTNNTGDQNAITATEVVHTITGSDFSFLLEQDADEDGELSSAEIATGVVASASDDTFDFELSSDFTTLTVTQNVNGAVDTGVSLAFQAPGAGSDYNLKEQSFTAAIEATNGTVDATALGETAVGAWDLNGASVYVPYMPYASNASQIIYVTNNGSQEGAIEVTAFDQDGNNYGPYDLGMAAANSVTKITGALEDELEADGFTSGKLAFTVTVTAPAGNIEVYSAYNAGGNDRGLVINSSNK